MLRLRSRLVKWVRDRRLTTQVIAFTSGILVIGVGILLIYLGRASRDNTLKSAVSYSQSLIEQYKTLRAYYTQNVISKLQNGHGIAVSYDHQDKTGVVPLPATLIHDLSREFEQQGTNLRMKLYSSHPFPHRRNREIDAFGREALAQLNEHPEEVFIRTGQMDGQDMVRVAVADRMVADSCVKCHNSHPDSPKKDWQRGDVRGVLEVDVPIGPELARNAALIRSSVFITLGMAAGILTLIFFIMRAMASRLRKATQVLGAIAAGDFSKRLDFSSRDEVGELAGALNHAIESLLRNAAEQHRQQMRQQLHEGEREKQQAENERRQAEVLRTKVDELLGVVDAAAEGDLTRAISVRGEDAIGRMGKGLSGFLTDLRGRIARFGENARTLNASAEELSDLSTQMSATAEETSAQANVVSAASQQVNKNVQTVATGIEEMSASIKEIARQAAEASKATHSAVGAAHTAETTVTKLGESSVKIDAVIKVITTIARQTNLLALNATIEAARAGDAGKGFGVVANEVKELARATAQATEDIGVKIQTIQGDTREAVEAICQIAQVIRQVNDISGTISDAVQEHRATTEEIVRNIVEAAKGSAEIAQNITAVAQAAKSTTEGAGNTHRASEELSGMAAQLQELISGFRYEEERDGEQLARSTEGTLRRRQVKLAQV